MMEPMDPRVIADLQTLEERILTLTEALRKLADAVDHLAPHGSPAAMAVTEARVITGRVPRQ